MTILSVLHDIFKTLLKRNHKNHFGHNKDGLHLYKNTRALTVELHGACLPTDILSLCIM